MNPTTLRSTALANQCFYYLCTRYDFVFIHKRIYYRRYENKLNLKKKANKKTKTSTTTIKKKEQKEQSQEQVPAPIKWIKYLIDEGSLQLHLSAGLFLRLCSCGPPLLCKPSEGLLSNSGEDRKKKLLLKKPLKLIPTNASKQIAYVRVKLRVNVA